MKYKCIITTRTGETINFDLSCREYHANKLNYILSRTLDRSIYTGAEVVAGFNSPAVEAAARLHVKKPVLVEKDATPTEEEKEKIAELWYRFEYLKKEIETYYTTGANSLQLEKSADENFYKIIELLKISVDDFEKELNEKNSRLYIVKYVRAEKVKRIYIYFKDCYYRLIDENMTKLLKSKIEAAGVL
jgi:hypothetical protein